MNASDRRILRDLAARLAERAHRDANAEKRRAWHALDAGRGDRPMILAELQGLPDVELPEEITTYECESDEARAWERRLRADIYRHDTLRDDHVIEPFVNVKWDVTTTDYGVRVEYHTPAGDGHVTARRWDSPITDLDRDLPLLKPRRFTVDRASTMDAYERASELFDGILQARIRGSHYWTLGMTWTAIELVGLERFMMAMYDNPDGVHRLMRFLADDALAFTGWLESEGLYTLNNENDYTGSGTLGYTATLPLPGSDPARPARQDLWCLSESQETVGVGPDMFGEFVFPYQKEVTDHFGRVYYGCCEPLHSRIDIIRQMKNLARVSVSPWADQEAMATACGRDLVFSRKPNPATISSSAWDEDLLREDIRGTLRSANGCRTEIIMKDVHTLAGEPDRLARWVGLARDESERFGA